MGQLGAGVSIKGPAIIIDQSSTILVENECEAIITENGDVKINIGKGERKAVRYIVSFDIFEKPLTEIVVLNWIAYNYLYFHIDL